jgi:hypothetical protein
MIRLYNQDVSVRAAPTAAKSVTESATDWRGSTSDSVATESVTDWIGSAVESATEWKGSVTDSVAAGSAHSWRGRTDWNTVKNYLSSMIANVVDDVANRLNECWCGQWWRRTLEHDSEYEIVQGLWSNYPVKGVINPVEIQWLD